LKELASDKLVNPRIIELEGKAQLGMVSEVRLEDCDFPEGWKRIVAELKDGSIESTGCMEPDAAKRNYMVMVLYTRKWGSLINQGEEE
jgi:hypothetical protein